MRRRRTEFYLLKPVYEILNYNDEWFDENWNKQKTDGKSEPPSDDEIELVMSYTQLKLNELLNYFKTIDLTNKISNQTLFFYTNYVDHLMEYHKDNFDKEYFLQYMFFYNELILGSQRYEAIKNYLNKFE